MKQNLPAWNDPRGFYGRYAQRYAEVSHGFLQSTYDNASHPKLTEDGDIIHRMRELIPARATGLDAGCGAGARDLFFYWQFEYDIWGIDAVQENIDLSREIHPEISDRVNLGDLTEPLRYPSGHFDFILCNAVIQHIDPDKVLNVTFREFNRVLKHGGVLQLMFKVGDGVKVIHDRDYETNREFRLYTTDFVMNALERTGFAIIPGSKQNLGGVMLFTDTKPMEHCLIFAKKLNSGGT